MKKILLLFGGRSTEHKVSCLSAKAIIENIDNNIYSLTTVGIDESDNWYIFNDDLLYLENGNWKEANNITLISNIINFLYLHDVIFPIIHGNNGEDGKLQGMLDLFNLKYVGSKTLGSANGMDKHIAKTIFDSVQISQVPYIMVKYPKYEVNDIVSKLDYPLIIKPANGGSSIGINKANNEEELIKYIEYASNYDQKVIIEKFMKIRELECSVIENNNIIVTSSIGEIFSANEIYDYNSKYENELSTTVVPADIPIDISNQIRMIAKKAFIAIEANGFSRIDFFYDEPNNKVYLNEINTLPGFTKISMFPKMLIHDGMTFKEIITTLIENA